MPSSFNSSAYTPGSCRLLRYRTEPYIALAIAERIQWATLSHCWGSSSHGITTASSIVDRKRKLEVAELPILYRDAIQIVRKLGIQYVWIDSLCIIQDSKPDWISESSKMDRYYSGAYLNISPSECTNSNMGIFIFDRKSAQSRLSFLGSFEVYQPVFELNRGYPLKKISTTRSDVPRGCKFTTA
jgi:hypothetical protein